MSHRYFVNKHRAVGTKTRVMKDTYYSHHTWIGYPLKQPQKNNSKYKKKKQQKDDFIKTMGMQLRLTHNKDHMPSE